MTPAVHAVEPEVDSDQNSILQACAHGRLEELKELFQLHYAHKEDATVRSAKVAVISLPQTISMFVAAIENNQLAVLHYLLFIDPKVDLEHPDIADAIIKSKQLNILQLVAQQSPRICDFEFDRNKSTFLTALCCEGPSASPLVEFLLDQGADVDGGSHHFSSLRMAMEHKLPVDIIRKMLYMGASWSIYTIIWAIDVERFDVVQLMLGYWHRQLQVSEENQLKKALEKCKNTGIIKLTNKFIDKKKIGYSSGVRSKIAQLYEQLTQIRIPKLPYSRKPEMEQVRSKEVLEKTIDGEESD